MKQQIIKLSRALMVPGVLVIATGCAPLMKTVTDYHPPQSDAGMQCVARANQDRNHCETDNRSTYTQCAEQAAYDSEQAYQEAREQYTYLLETYVHDVEHYERAYGAYREKKELFLNSGKLKYIQCSDDVKLERIEEFPKCEAFLIKARKKVKKLREPHAPVKPYPPSRDVIYDQLRAACNNLLNDCETSFNNAYRACGGTISYRQVCIKNCD